MLRDAVVLAAGRGTRIRAGDTDLPKPLQPVLGVSLLQRTLRALAAGGCERAVVVIGFLGDEIRAARIAVPGLAIDYVENRDFDRANGVSVSCVRSVVPGPFVLSMADHVYVPRLVQLARAADLDAADLHLCVDRRIAEIYDVDDATKVRTDADRIVEIGKQLATYDCIDCGVFAVTHALIDAIDEHARRAGDCSLSDGVRALAARGRARVIDIGDAFWQDVDTAGALERAERELARLGVG